jgi:peptide/nickel transport system ATP-binding protein
MAGSGTGHLRNSDDVLLRVENLVVEYAPVGRGRVARVQAVSDISFDICRGETLGLVGESGCGKSTVGRAVMMLTPPRSGRVLFQGRELTALKSRELRRARRELHMIFQDPISSLNPRRTVRGIVSEGLAIGRVSKPWTHRVNKALVAVGLDPASIGVRRRVELSGGQCQRVVIARALVLDPALIICDEPVSALDVSIQAQILNLLEEMKAQYQLTILFISHNLAVIKSISDRVAVMYLGKLCEIAEAGELYANPQHPYTEALLRAIPQPDPALPLQPMEVLGDLPSPTSPPTGCRFRTRCPWAAERCAVEEPAIRQITSGHFLACHFPRAEAVADSRAATQQTTGRG